MPASLSDKVKGPLRSCHFSMPVLHGTILGLAAGIEQFPEIQSLQMNEKLVENAWPKYCITVYSHNLGNVYCGKPDM